MPSKTHSHPPIARPKERLAELRFTNSMNPTYEISVLLPGSDSPFVIARTSSRTPGAALDQIAGKAIDYLKARSTEFDGVCVNPTGLGARNRHADIIAKSFTESLAASFNGQFRSYTGNRNAGYNGGRN